VPGDGDRLRQALRLTLKITALLPQYRTR
jgi:hypothetical protein